MVVSHQSDLWRRKEISWEAFFLALKSKTPFSRVFSEVGIGPERTGVRGQGMVSQEEEEDRRNIIQDPPHIARGPSLSSPASHHFDFGQQISTATRENSSK